jgi:Imelysin
MKKSFALTTILALGFAASAQPTDLNSVKTYLLTRLELQKAGTSALKTAAQRYYDLAKTANFDYKKLAQSTDATRNALRDARAGWVKASPVYESVEGIVAGVESLAEYDLNLDAGASKLEGGDAVVTFDLKLPNGKTLEKPGNLFGINESTLWGTFAAFSSGVTFDLDGNGQIGFGDALPDANVLKAAADLLDSKTQDLINSGKAWQPTLSDVFGAMVANVPTVAPVFLERWKNSRFVIGTKSTSRDFVVISSLNDLLGNVTSWQQLYKGVSGAVKQKNSNLDAQINTGLSDLRTWVAKLTTQEKSRAFTPEQASLIYKEGDNRATAITGKISQAAALLGVKGN